MTSLKWPPFVSKNSAPSVEMINPFKLTYHINFNAFAYIPFPEMCKLNSLALK